MDLDPLTIKAVWASTHRAPRRGGHVPLHAQRPARSFASAGIYRRLGSLSDVYGRFLREFARCARRAHADKAYRQPGGVSDGHRLFQLATPTSSRNTASGCREWVDTTGDRPPHQLEITSATSMTGRSKWAGATAGVGFDRNAGKSSPISPNPRSSRPIRIGSSSSSRRRLPRHHVRQPQVA